MPRLSSMAVPSCYGWSTSSSMQQPLVKQEKEVLENYYLYHCEAPRDDESMQELLDLVDVKQDKNEQDYCYYYDHGEELLLPYSSSSSSSSYSSGITYCEVEDGDQFFYHGFEGYYFYGDSNITESTSSFASFETDNSVVTAADPEDALFWDELGPLQPSATTLRPQLPINCPVLPPTKKKKAKLAAASATKKSDFLMTKEELAKYFHMPITKAARELKVGLTALKKRCRELGVKRWPHRKLKSLQKLIDNVSRMAEAVESEEGVGSEGDYHRVRLEKAIRLLENERKMLDESPDLELGTSTKRLRQACFKANYKKKQMNGSVICS